MLDYPNILKAQLFSIINEMSESPALFVKNPGHDFTRTRKLPFDEMLRTLLFMGGNSIYKELLESQDYDVNTATTSAFIQQRDKILPDAFQFLFNEFTESCSLANTYRGYRLTAVDGSDLHYATDPDDPETYGQNRPGEKGYNLLHLNAMYDLRNRVYTDAIIQPRKSANEHEALTDLVDRSRIPGKVILLADRGYECYNNFAHIENKGWNYIIRVKDLCSSGGILSGLFLPKSGAFDVSIQRILTFRQTNEVKQHPEIYRCLGTSTTFDFLDKHNMYYPISFRVVRFKITDDSYETVITNLDHSEFPPAELKALYNMRWGIETSFRKLKYTIGLSNFHARKREYITQEIFARLTTYNFSEIITAHVIVSKADTKHIYQVNFTVAVHVCRRFLRLRNNAPSLDVEALIRNNTLPIRPDRQDDRKVRTKSVVSFLYRVA